MINTENQNLENTDLPIQRTPNSFSNQEMDEILATQVSKLLEWFEIKKIKKK